MITRFYVDNYKCLQNFEYKPQQFELIVGANGTGKSTVFEALDKVRRFVTGQADARELFPRDCGTRWSTRPQQVFEVDYTFGTREAHYRLEINLNSIEPIEKEVFMLDGKVICETIWEQRNGQEFNQSLVVNNTASSALLTSKGHVGQVRFLVWEQEELKVLLAESNRSAFSNDIFFTQAIWQIYFLKINPAIMTSQVKKAESRPANDLSDFASYYIYMLQQKQGRMFEMMQHLRDSIKDFDSFAVEEDFEEGRRNLQVNCKQLNGKRGAANLIKYGFEEMSDGQRALIALYTLLFCTLDTNVTLIIDEPENYVALRELQPWLMLLQDRLEEYGGQVILISHHPEFINALAPGNTTVFEREDNGPVRIKPFSEKMVAALSPAEIMARGWEHE